MSFLVIDIGNTRLKWGMYAHAAPDADLLAHGAVVLEDIDDLWEQSWRDLPPPRAMLGCVVAGEVIKRRVEEQLQDWGLTPRWLASTKAAAGVINGYEHPQRLGSDRWAAIIGARQRVLQAASGAAPQPVLAVMVGTAVTVDAVDQDGRFLGGLIMPGFGLMYKALESGTAGLKVPTGEVRDFPTNTSDALMSGGTDAIAGAIERSLRRLREHTGRQPLLIMSGGAVSRLSHLDELQAQIVENLIFEGLLTLASQPASGA